jgi:hypothetical protein
LDDYNLGGVNEDINILSSQVHTMFQENMREITDFDNNDKRWELFQSPEAWNLITNDYRAFWIWIRETKQFKQMIWLSDANTGPVWESITAITDNAREFKQVNVNSQPALIRHLNQDYQFSMRNELNGKSKIVFVWEYYTGAGTTQDPTVYQRRLWVLKYDPTVTQMVQAADAPGNPSSTNPGYEGYRVLPVNAGFWKSRWAWMCTEFTLLTDDNDRYIAHPKVGNATPSGGVSERERIVHMIPGNNNATRVMYGTDNKKSLVWQSTATDEMQSPFYTNTEETFMALIPSTGRIDLIDRVANTHRVVTPNIALGKPNYLTKCSLSPDGTMLAWTDRTANTPRLRIVRLSDGNVIYTSAINAACTSAIWTDHNSIICISTTGLLSRYAISGHAGQLFVQEVSNYENPATGEFIAHHCEVIDKIIFIKRASGDYPLYFIVDTPTGRVDYIRPKSAHIGILMSLHSTNFMRRVPGHLNWFLIPTNTVNYTILLKYDEATQTWSETILGNCPVSYGNDQYLYLTQLFYDRGAICAWWQTKRDVQALPIPVYDLNTGETMPIHMLNGSVLVNFPTQNWATIRKLDESHLAYSGNTYTGIYEIDKVNRRVIEKVRQEGRGRSCFYGFNDDSV